MQHPSNIPRPTQGRFLCLPYTSRPVQKTPIPYHRQEFDLCFPDVAQENVGTFQVLVEVLLVGKGDKRLLWA